MTISNEDNNMNTITDALPVVSQDNRLPLMLVTEIMSNQHVLFGPNQVRFTTFELLTVLINRLMEQGTQACNEAGQLVEENDNGQRSPVGWILAKTTKYQAKILLESFAEPLATLERFYADLDMEAAISLIKDYNISYSDVRKLYNMLSVNKFQREMIADINNEAVYDLSH
jgi:YD repeat-containing protein